MTAYSQSSANDNAIQNSTGAVSLSNLNLLYASNVLWAGIRFVNVSIPNGATITSATLGMNVSSSKYDDPNVTFRIEAADNSAGFTTTANNIGGRSKGTSSVAYNILNSGAGYDYIDVTQLVSEVVGRTGWASGNAISFIGQLNVGCLAAYAAATTGPTLDVTYTYNVPTNVPVTGFAVSHAFGVPTLSVAGEATSNSIPSGRVDIFDGDTDQFIGSVVLNSAGKGQLLLPPLASGDYTFYAVYNGNVKFAPSTSATQSLTVTSSNIDPPPEPDIGDWEFGKILY